MDPISVSIELELGALLLGVVGAAATWLHNRHQKARHEQREQHHRQHLAALAASREPAGLRLPE